MNLNTRIGILKCIATDDGAGGIIEEFKVVRNISANIKELNAKEQYTAKQISQETTHSIVIRFTNNIDRTENYIKYKKSILKIETIIPFDKEGRFLKLSCTDRW